MKIILKMLRCYISFFVVAGMSLLFSSFVVAKVDFKKNPVFVCLSRLHEQWCEHRDKGGKPIQRDLVIKYRKACEDLIQKTGASAVLIYEDNPEAGGYFEFYITIDPEYDVTQQIVNQLNIEYLLHKQ